jgi:hypothetical protein
MNVDRLILHNESDPDYDKGAGRELFVALPDEGDVAPVGARLRAAWPNLAKLVVVHRPELTETRVHAHRPMSAASLAELWERFGLRLESGTPLEEDPELAREARALIG